MGTKIADHSMLIQILGSDKEKIRQFLSENDIVEIRVNEHIRVNQANYMANFETYLKLGQ
jgi:hypothetical protein